MKKKNFQSRLQFSKLLCALAAAAVLLGLFYLQVKSHKNLSEGAESEIKRTVSEFAPRGDILDANMEVLARSVKTWDCYILKSYFDDKQKGRILAAAAGILGVSHEMLKRRYKNSSNYVTLKRGARGSDFMKIKELGAGGVYCDERLGRFYPNGELAKNVIGVVNSQNEGVSGIELMFNNLLRGGRWKRGILRDAAGRIIYAGNLKRETRPLNISLTIDKNIQFFCESLLEEYVEKTKSDFGLVVVQNPDNGFIYATASRPMDINSLPAAQWVFEPGSTFKTVTLAAALAENSVRPTDKFFCENGEWKFFPGITLHDHEPEGELKVREIIERSSNIGCAKIGMKLGIKKIYKHLTLLGFGRMTGSGFYGESRGIVRPLEKYRPVDLAVLSYGHGIAVTPLQLISAYSAMANGGYLYEPKIIKRITDHEGKNVYKTPKMLVRKVLDGKTLETVKEILEGVVETGTGKKAAVKGYSVAGKTGTSKKIDEKGQYLTNVYIVSFAGFFPVDKPRFTILTVLDHPKRYYYASDTAAPLFREIAEKIIILKGLEPDKLPEGKK